MPGIITFPPGGHDAGAQRLIQLSAEVRTAVSRLDLAEVNLAQRSEEVLRAWLAVRERIAEVIDEHGLKGRSFAKWCKDANINPKRAYELYKLSPEDIISYCEAEQKNAAAQGELYRWPSWKRFYRERFNNESVRVEADRQPFAYNPYFPVNRCRDPNDNSDQRETPQDLFDFVNDIYHFDLDVCSTDTSFKVKPYFTKEMNALTRPWRCRCAWMNPPFRDRMLYAFCEYAWQEVQKGNAGCVVGLVPAWPAAPYFEPCTHGKIFLLRKRIRFDNENYEAPFSSMLVVWQGRSKRKNNVLDVELLDIPKPPRGKAM